MIFIQIFLVLSGIIFSAAALLGGLFLTFHYAVDADAAEEPLAPAIVGTVVRLFLTIAVTTVLAGTHLLLLGL